ncbi:MAG: carboxypeptidase-like regulatory domain-containing protein [Ignavibacteria bacterium]|nr:carboxypeptidase-like regulatory domain-containing protein [Ignavibacteria bacterium]
MRELTRIPSVRRRICGVPVEPVGQSAGSCRSKTLRTISRWCVVFLASTSFGQIPNSATLTGTVLDHSTKDPLQAVNVLLKDSHLGAATDSTGRYVIRGIPPELFVIEFRYVGYKTKYRTHSFHPGQHMTIDVMLEEHPIPLAEITVRDTVDRSEEIHRYPGSIVITRQHILESGADRVSKVFQQLAPRLDLYTTRIRSQRNPSRRQINIMLVIDGVRVRVDSYDMIMYDPDYFEKLITIDEIDYMVIHRDANAWLRSGARRLEPMDWMIEIVRRKK